MKISAAVFSDSGKEYTSDFNGESADESIKKAKFSEKKKATRHKEKLINFMVLTNQPASLVENKVFRDFCKELNSSFQPPCRTTFNNNSSYVRLDLIFNKNFYFYY